MWWLTKPTIFPAKVSFPHFDMSIVELAGHLLPLNAAALQHWSSPSKSLLKRVPLFLVQRSLQVGAYERSKCLPSIHSSFIPNNLESQPLAQQSFLTNPHTNPPLFLHSYPSRKWDWALRWNVSLDVRARVATIIERRRMILFMICF